MRPFITSAGDNLCSATDMDLGVILLEIKRLAGNSPAARSGSGAAQLSQNPSGGETPDAANRSRLINITG